MSEDMNVTEIVGRIESAQGQLSSLDLPTNEDAPSMRPVKLNRAVMQVKVVVLELLQNQKLLFRLMQGRETLSSDVKPADEAGGQSEYVKPADKAGGNGGESAKV